MKIIKIPEKELSKIVEDIDELEKRSGVKIKRKDNAFYIEGDESSEWICEQVLNALSNGFSTKNAFKLFSDDYFIDEIDIENAVWRKEKTLERIKGRIIGEEGKAKKTIEELTGAQMIVGDKKVFFIGRFDEVKNAKEAVLRLMEGAKHTQVYNYLKRLS
ncbi:MAG: KH domain-containing protein [Candidatus Marsarchaeota archaeon]|nr:KH domain-containing protein [Candidatus Marsarchaeota archaeon]